MTISTETVKITVQGNGVQTVFAYNFLLPVQDEYSLYLVGSDGSYSLVALADYSVTGIGVASGGTFTYSPAISADQSLVLVRGLPYTQLTNYRNQAAYYPQTVEGTFDTTVMQIQQLFEIAGRSFQAPITEGAVEYVPVKELRSDRFAAWDSDGNLTYSELVPSDFTGHLTITADQSINTTPTANALPTQSSLLVQGETQWPDTREFLVNIGFTTNLGQSHTGNYLGDKVALYVGVSAQAGTGDVWALNSALTLEAGSGTYNAQGYELDFNNLNAHRGDTAGALGLAAPVSYAFTLTGVNAYRNTAALLLGGGAMQSWNRGIVCVDGVVQSSFQDFGVAERSLDIRGGMDIGLSLEQGVFSRAPILLRNATFLSSRDSADSQDVGLINLDVFDSVVLGDGFNPYVAVVVQGGGGFVPQADDSYTLGFTTNRWSEVYAANGVINTSGRAFKKNIVALAETKTPMTDVLRAIQPIKFQRISGGGATEEYTEEVQVPVTIETTGEIERAQLVDGVARMVKIPQTSAEKVYDEHPVLDENGNQIIDMTKEQPALYDRQGNMLRAAVPPQPVPRVLRVPRMQTVTVTKKRPVQRPGKRTHYGFGAGDFKEVFDKLGLGDFGGYVTDDKGNEGLRSDQILALLWQAVREVDDRLTTAGI